MNWSGPRSLKRSKILLKVYAFEDKFPGLCRKIKSLHSSISGAKHERTAGACHWRMRGDRAGARAGTFEEGRLSYHHSGYDATPRFDQNARDRTCTGGPAP